MNVAVVVIAILSLLLVPVPCILANTNGHRNPGGVTTLAIFGIFVFPLLIVAIAWAVMGADPARVAGRPASPGSSADDVDLPLFEILGTNERGEQVRYTAPAASADDARFIAAERGLKVLALRELPVIAKAKWFVDGLDLAGREMCVMVRAEGQTDAYLAATRKGLVKPLRIVQLPR